MEKISKKAWFVIWFGFFTAFVAVWVFITVLHLLEPLPKFSTLNFYLLIGIILFYYASGLNFIRGISGKPSPPPLFFIMGIIISSLLAGLTGITLLWHVANSGQGVFPSVKTGDVIIAIIVLLFCLLNAVISISLLLSNFKIVPKEKTAPESEVAEEKTMKAEAEK